jgi:aldehyde dehydrogenase (NAD+)
MAVFENYVGGRWVGQGDPVANIDPSNADRLIGDYVMGDAELASEAVAAAREAFPSWSHSTPQQRFDVLDRAASELLARKDEIGALLSREEGKTLAEGIGETVRAAMIFKFFAGEALRIVGDVVASVRPGVAVEVTREAVGVIGLITPWNFPIAIPAWKIAPALAHGNCVVFKPAELTPGCGWILTDILSRAGLPAGVLNLVMGRGTTVGQALLDAPGIDAISFTGSVATGQRVIAATTARGARVQCEMGGKNPLIVLDDANLDLAVDCAVQGAYFSTGQRCTASSRLIVTRGIHDAFVERLHTAVAALRVGDALDPATQIGPVVDQRQFDNNLRYIAQAVAEGAELACGGERLERAASGFYQAPALFVGTSNAMTINAEEVFGPVATVIEAADYDEALSIANDTPFGLTAGICTSSLSKATHFRRHAEVGMAMVNLPTAGVDYHVPFGGRKASSYGPREQGSYAREFYTIVKTAYTLAG